MPQSMTVRPARVQKGQPVPLNPGQQRIARMIVGLAESKGIPRRRALELAAAAYAESGLNPRATNRSSGAAGLFQLLSGGYRSRADRLGGLYDPRANTLAILPDYQRYWQQHPNAAPGDAGRDVERSGMGSSFYSRPLGLLNSIGGAVASEQGPPPALPLSGGPAAPAPDLRQQLALMLARGGRLDLVGLAARVRAQQTAQPAPPPPGLPAAATLAGAAAGAAGKIIGLPGQGTHTLGNWESDRAVDEALPKGTPIRAPFDGVIGSQFGSLGKGGRFAGLRVHILGKRDEAYLAHLEKFAPGIAPGAHVRRGQIIGYSGSANGVPHLHEALRRGDPRSIVPLT
jgi:murein DD-endopeptidase MepM/ murein hydrolase activator NlpD